MKKNRRSDWGTGRPEFVIGTTPDLGRALLKIKNFAINEKLRGRDVETIFESGMFVLQGFGKRLTPALKRFMDKAVKS